MEDQDKLRPGRLSNAERLEVLTYFGELAKLKYNEFLREASSNAGYDLRKLRDALQYKSNAYSFQNTYYLELENEDWTRIAYYFEYGTGLFNRKAATTNTTIKPVYGKYLKIAFKCPVIFRRKDGSSKITNVIFAKEVKGVQAMLSMTNAKVYIEDNKPTLWRHIRLEYQKWLKNQ